MKKEDLFDAIGMADDNLLEESEKLSKKRPSPWAKWAAMAACLCLVTAMVYGVSPWVQNADTPKETPPENITPSEIVIDSTPKSTAPQTAAPQATLPLPGSDFGPDLDERKGAPPEISGTPPVPNDAISWEEARLDENFGAYLPREKPFSLPEDTGELDGSGYESLRRPAGGDMLLACWAWGYHDLWWKVTRLTEADEARICAPDAPERYELARYPIPRCDSVPEELREVVDNPIFRAEDLTLELVKARSETWADSGDTTGPRIRFSVLYGDVLVEITSKGLSPEWIYGQLTALAPVDS